MSPRWIVTFTLSALTLDAAAEPCAGGQSIELVEKSGAGMTVCFATYKGKDRSCWKVDAKGVATAMPEKQWPATTGTMYPTGGDRLMPTVVDNINILVPPKLTVKVSNEYEQPATVDVCEGSACKHVVLRAQKKERTSLHAVFSVTVLPDKKTMWVGVGLGTQGAESLERYDLDSPRTPPTKLAVPQCSEIIGLGGGNMLVQTTDCANAGGERMIFTQAGRMLTKAGYAASGSPFYNLGGDRVLLASHQGAAVWDMASGRRLAQLPGEDRDLSAAVVLGDKVLAVEYTGEVWSYDAALKPTKVGSIPRCRKP
jgi:hypothetical protein